MKNSGAGERAPQNFMQYGAERRSSEAERTEAAARRLESEKGSYDKEFRIERKDLTDKGEIRANCIL